MPVYTTFKGGFGDAWGAANYFLRLSEETGEPTKVFNLDPRIREIVPLLDSVGSVVEVEQSADVLVHSHRDPSVLRTLYPYQIPPIVIPWGVVFAREFFKTKIAIWQPNSSRTIAIQLIPRHDNDKKGCPAEHRAYFCERMKSAGYEVAEMGLPASIVENIQLASKAQAFIGICSGMSHLCYSVRIPVHLLRNDQDSNTLAICHQGNPHREYANVFDVIREFCP